MQAEPSPFGNDDIEIILRQLNAKQIYPAEIVKRCPHGYPSVVLMFPVDNCDIKSKNDKHAEHAFYKIISNILWLTCPYLNEIVHDIEDHGYIEKISYFIKDNRIYENMMKTANAEYYYLRKNLYSKYYGNIQFNKHLVKIFNTGIGGIRDIDFIKCLHLHYAHYTVCRENIAGKIVSNIIGKNICCNNKRCKNI